MDKLRKVLALMLALAMIFHALYNLLVSDPGASRTVGYLLPLLAAAGLYCLFRKLPLS